MYFILTQWYIYCIRHVDHTIQLWEVGRIPAQICVYKGHTRTVKSVALVSDGRWIVAGSGNGTVRVWDVKTGDIVVRQIMDWTKTSSGVTQQHVKLKKIT